MCGLTGFVGAGDQDDLSRMANAIRHRGPDGQGTYCQAENGVFLAHTRLAIIDLENGQQPMQTIDRNLVVTFNGEIYNHLELRQELEALGHVFVTDHSDTEVLLHGWRQWGRDLPLKLNGMFAFVLYDLSKKLLFMARDRFGEKPLFWSKKDDQFSFASELTSIAALWQFNMEVNRTALKKYFAYGFIPAPNSLYKDCYKLPAGCWLEYDLIDKSVNQQRYWAYEIEPEESGRTEEDLAEELYSLLVKSVKRRLMSDVPLGIFLSGGMDSSAILSACRATEPDRKFNTFSIGFENPSFDETEYANIVAEHLDSVHHGKILDIDGAVDIIRSVLSQLDEPISDPSILPTYLLAQFTRQHVTVALSGDGGDELFAGYDPFKALKPAALYKTIMPSIGHKTFMQFADLLPRSNKNMSFDFKLRRFLQGLSQESHCWHPSWMAPFRVEDIQDLFYEPTSAEELYSEAIDLWYRDENLDSLDRSLEYFVRFYLQDNILVKVDRATMLNGLESRAPFLDPEIAEFSRKLPNRLKLKGKQQKYILHKALRLHLPEKILDRPKKGFGIPLLDWLKQIPMSSGYAESFGLNHAVLDRQQTENRSGRVDHRLALWSTIPLQYNSMANS